MKLSELEAKRGDAKKEMAELLEARDKAGAEFTAEQLTRYNTL